MGGIILLGTLFAVYILVYWCINIELFSDKTTGFLGFSTNASARLNIEQETVKRFSKKKQPPASTISDNIPPISPKKFKKQYLKK